MSLRNLEAVEVDLLLSDPFDGDLVLRAGNWIDPRGGEISFAEWCDLYFEGATHKRATTLSSDRNVTRVHPVPALGTRALIDITPVHVRKLVAKMTESLAPTTVRTNYGVLRTILAAAVDADLLVRSPCRGIGMPPHRRKEVRFLSPHEFERLADAMPLDYRPMIYVAGVLGLRWSEVAGLRAGRIDLVERRLAVLETLAEVEGRVASADVKSPASRRVISMPGFISSMLFLSICCDGDDRDRTSWSSSAPTADPSTPATFATASGIRPS